ncbi:hypothetical protein BJ170DRAFT_595735 [Xylariales sp. AK1849]|nr:hypothetical protein BJ170DRAFT_595735 [Xylariales sp. AK1849]
MTILVGVLCFCLLLVLCGQAHVIVMSALVQSGSFSHNNAIKYDYERGNSGYSPKNLCVQRAVRKLSSDAVGEKFAWFDTDGCRRLAIPVLLAVNAGGYELNTGFPPTVPTLISRSSGGKGLIWFPMQDEEGCNGNGVDQARGRIRAHRGIARTQNLAYIDGRAESTAHSMRNPRPPVPSSVPMQKDLVPTLLEHAESMDSMQKAVERGRSQQRQDMSCMFHLIRIQTRGVVVKKH